MYIGASYLRAVNARIPTSGLSHGRKFPSWNSNVVMKYSMVWLSGKTVGLEATQGRL